MYTAVAPMMQTLKSRLAAKIRNEAQLPPKLPTDLEKLAPENRTEHRSNKFQLIWVMLGRVPAARSHGVKQFTALWGLYCVSCLLRSHPWQTFFRCNLLAKTFCYYRMDIWHAAFDVTNLIARLMLWKLKIVPPMTIDRSPSGKDLIVTSICLRRCFLSMLRRPQLLNQSRSFWLHSTLSGFKNWPQFKAACVLEVICLQAIAIPTLTVVMV